MEIIATISVNSYSYEKIKEIITNGATMLRYNLAHLDPQGAIEKFEIARQVIKDLSVENVKIIADFPGAKVRLGEFIEEELLVKGKEYTFKSAKTSKSIEEYIPVDYKNIGTLVTPDQWIPLADGEIAFKVTTIIDDNSFNAVSITGRAMHPQKGIHFGDRIDELNHVTDKTLDHLKNINNINPDGIMFSFVRSKEQLKENIDLLNKYKKSSFTPTVFSKIETLMGVENIKEILEVTDMVIVARGDLGLYAPYESLGILQKKIVNACIKANKKVFVSTQILESVLDSAIPKRSDILDLTNIVFDGADGIMLAKETGISLTPGYSVQVAKKIIDSVTKDLKSIN